MKYETVGNKLVITIDQEERDQLLEESLENENFESDDFMCEFLEPLVCNSELNWIDSTMTGDLTDAPMLGIFDHENQDEQIVVDRWAFMDYMTKSVQRELLNHGQVTFIQ